VQQVTYNGLPLYRFIFDEEPGETEGANLFDPITSPTGTWYLVDPSRGRFATGQAQLQWETAPVTGTTSNATVLAATMNNDFSIFQNATFPVYTLSADTGAKSACEGLCALFWQPVLTDGRATAGPNVDQHAIGVSIRADGSHQVTYNGKPLYFWFKDLKPGDATGDGIDDIIRQARRYKSKRELTRAIRLIAKADLALRSNPPSKRMMLEKLVLDLTMEPKPEIPGWSQEELPV